MNRYFLCKFLKDTLLQSKTYLFCAIRPEVEYLKYTFATLGFAKNASVVQLAPKKATTACTPAERKLLAQLEQMKQELEAAKKAASEGGGAASVARRGADKLHHGQSVPSGAPSATRQRGVVTTLTGLRLLGVERARARGTSVRNPVVAGATPRVMPDAARLRAECVAKTVKARPRRGARVACEKISSARRCSVWHTWQY